MSAHAYSRGHPIQYAAGCWRYSDTGEPIDGHERPCARCGKMPTPEGYDACLGHIDGATSACCGHGVEAPYIVMEGDGNA